MPARMRLFYLFAVVLFLVIDTSRLPAQINGVPASVTSFGFGGSHSFTPGVAASVTSLGPNGFGGHARFGSCCFNPFFHSRGQSPMFVRGHRSHRGFFPFSGVGYPYTQVVVVPEADAYYDDEDEYEGGPTIFDRRGSYPRRSGVPTVERESAPQPAAAAAPPEPVVAQPSTLLIFRDGHQTELQNYAIVGDTLFDLTDNRSHKIQLADLDLPATRKANDTRGVDFEVPATMFVDIR
jgi:hypothetical protein